MSQKSNLLRLNDISNYSIKPRNMNGEIHQVKKTLSLVISFTILGGTLLSGCGHTKQAMPSQNSSQTNEISKNSTSPNSNENTKPLPPGLDKNTSTNEQSKVQLVNQIMSLAKEGKVMGVPFIMQSNMEDVYHSWGKTTETTAGAGIYTTYDSHHTDFGFNKGGQIFDLRSYSKDLQTITQSDITQVLGKPGSVRYTSDSYIYLYPAGADYQLLWVFPKDSAGKPSSHVDHISVFWPEGTVNSMAQTQPAPSVVINNTLGSVGSLFTFSIKDTPKNYHLAELEWIPNNHSAVVNTLSEALINAQNGGKNIPCFNISKDGQTMSFIYSSNMKNQSGYVRVIFQTTSGSAMIGQSPAITLK